MALAYGCQALNIPCTLYCERDPSQKGVRAHSFTALAEQWGASVVLVDSLAAAEQRSGEFSDATGALKIPLGLQCREFERYFQEAIRHALDSIHGQIAHLPTRVWLPAGSGTLASAFYAIAPTSTQLLCVNVHVLPGHDTRMQKLRELPRIQLFSAKERFQEKASYPPPIPSNLHYDAKIWAFVAELAEDGDLWWNVAR